MGSPIMLSELPYSLYSAHVVWLPVPTHLPHKPVFIIHPSNSVFEGTADPRWMAWR